MPLFNFVKSKLSILEVIGEYVQLKPIGGYWKGACPFHSEKDPSFTVSPDKQIFYCFGCHSGGDLISFIAKIENLSQIEAVRYLIERYKIAVPEELENNFVQNTEKLEEKDNYFLLNKVFSDWCNKKLFENLEAQKYLSERLIDKNHIEFFNLGYFPGGIKSINDLLKFIANKGFLAKDLLEVGILMDGKSILYSPFEERIIFPIKDILGRYCGFGGRIFKLNDQRAKYYNSKETAYFLKGKLLFGLDFAKKEMQNKASAFLVEGYTDCIAMVKNGYLNTVATLGTACTIDHLKILSRFIDKLYVLYDGDNAGQNAILRLTQLCWEVNLELQIVRLPQKHDPASYLNAGLDLNKLVLESTDIFSFFVESLGNNFVSASLSERLLLSDKILQVIFSLDDKFKQNLLLQRFASVIQVPVEVLKEWIFDQKKQFFRDSIKEPIKKTVTSEQKVSVLEERIFSAIINTIDNADRFYIEIDLIQYFSEYIQFLLRKLYEIINSEDLKEKKFNLFLEQLNESDKNWVIQCSLKYSHDGVTKDFFNQLIFHFCKQNWKQIVQDIKVKLFNAQQQKDEAKLQELFSLFSKLKEGIKDRGLI